MVAPVVIFAIGNPSRGDDAIGPVLCGRLAEWLKISTSVFRRDQQDLIDWTPTPYAKMPRQTNLVPGTTYALATNLSSVRTQGLELDVRLDRSLGQGNRLLLMTGLLLLESLDADKTPSFYISSHARVLLNSTMVLTTGRCDFSLQTLYNRRNTQASTAISAYLDREYFLTNVKLRYRIPKIQTSVFLQGYNLFDRSYSDLLGARMPGRWVSFGMQFGR
jgi:iron complex outermembrane receptor protein